MPPSATPPSLTPATTAALLEEQSVAMDEALESATVNIGGTDYAATVVAGALRKVPTADGWQNQQSLRVDVRKTLMPARPAHTDLVRWAGFTFTLDSSGGDEAQSLCWTIRATRIC